MKTASMQTTDYIGHRTVPAITSAVRRPNLPDNASVHTAEAIAPVLSSLFDAFGARMVFLPPEPVRNGVRAGEATFASLAAGAACSVTREKVAKYYEHCV
jgi:hypothetical protein